MLDNRANTLCGSSGRTFVATDFLLATMTAFSIYLGGRRVQIRQRWDWVRLGYEWIGLCDEFGIERNSQGGR